MELYHVKLKNGEDVVGYVEWLTEADFLVTAPITITIDPTLGFFAKSLLLLSETNSVRLQVSDTLFANPASEKAKRYYDEFMHKIAAPSYDTDPTDSDFTRELEDIFSAMIESKGHIKH